MLSKPTKNPAKKNKGGRPKLKLDPKKIAKLAEIQCTYEEMAAVMGCSRDTLDRRFSALIKENQERGRSSLRRWQYKAARAGSITMMIWLGKQLLGQKDRIEQDVNVHDRTQTESEVETLLTEVARQYPVGSP